MQKIMKNKMRRTDGSIADAFGRGMVVSAASELILLAIAASLTSCGIAAESMMHIFAALCAAVSSFIGAFICALAAHKLTLPLALGVGAAQFAVNFVLGILFSDDIGFTALMPASFMAGAAAAGVLSAMKKGRK